MMTNSPSDLYPHRIEVMENWAQYLTAGVDGPFATLTGPRVRRSPLNWARPFE